MLAPHRVRGYRHDGCYALLPLHPAPVRSLGIKNIYDPKAVAIHILRKPAVGDLKRPFKAAGMFGAGAFRPRHRLLFFLPYSVLLAHQLPDQKQTLLLPPKPRKRLERIRSKRTLEGESTCRFLDLWSVRTLVYRLDGVVFKSTFNTNHLSPRVE